MFRRRFYWVSGVLLAGIAVGAWFHPAVLWALVVVGPIVALGLHDALQTRHAVLRNWPLIGRFRYGFEAIRPEIQQYFIESNTEGKPFSREWRTLAYQRAKREADTVAFGTQDDVYEPGYEWMHHSLAARPVPREAPRVPIGGAACTQPYAASYLNISAMSYGSLSSAAVRALGAGAKAGGFAHNTGEGGISPYHLEAGQDLVYQVGTGYFGCRDPRGGFCPERFAERAALASVRMIEIKLSQGAKPGHGGILPARKVTAEIASIRGVPEGRRVDSPPVHSAFRTPIELCEFIARLRGLSGGKPVGVKLCVGDLREVLALCKAMRVTGILPDYLAVDGGEGGTGAAPLEFTNSVGRPLREGLVTVHNALVGAGLRDGLRIVASGKIITGFHMVRALALGADVCASARGFMFALGCIQALRCNSNTCPVGVATQDAALVHGLVAAEKGPRVRNFQHETVRSFLELVAAAGLEDPTGIGPEHVWRRVDDTNTRSYRAVYEWIDAGSLLTGAAPPAWRTAWDEASADRFQRVG